MQTAPRKDLARPPSRASAAAKGMVLLGCVGIAAWVAHATADQPPSSTSAPPTAFTAATSGSRSPTRAGAGPTPTGPTPTGPTPTAAPQPPAAVSEGSRPLDLKVAKPGSDAANIATVLRTGLLPRSGGAFGADRIRALPGQGPRRSLAVRITYPAGSASSRSASLEGSAYGGTQVYLLLPHGPVEAATLSYCLRFPVGFDFVKGGKLPGLFGGTVTSGQHIPDGTDGWSTRYMWRRGGAGEVYAYLPTSVAHGTSLGRGAWSITPGRWQCLAQTVVLNTPGVANGSVTLRLDGRQVFAAKGLLFRTTSALRIDGVFFSTFFGGGDPSWASPRLQYADFADVAVAS